MTSKKMKGASIVIPCYKRPGQVSRCLKLLLGSTGLDRQFKMEIILVDDSPDDKIKRLVKKLATKKPACVSFKYKKPSINAGIAAARNIGVSLASNEIIIATDSDIEVEKETVLETIRTFEKHKTGAMVSGNVYWLGGAVDGKLDRPRRHDRRIKVGKTTYIEMLHGRYVAFLKKAFEKVGGYDAELFPMQGEGPDLSISFWRAGYPLVYNPKIKVHHLSGYAKKEKIKSPYLYHGWNMRRTALMFRSILLYFYKYGCLEPRKSNWMKTIALESARNFGEISEYVILSSLSSTLDWISENRKKIERSKGKIPKKYDFKPYDVFTDRKLLMKCVKKHR
jgi:GT2 family glycosyltransferase